MPVEDSRKTRVYEESPARHVIAVGKDLALTLPLPESGTVSLGRVEGVDLVVPDASVSRRHACLHVGDEIAIEDLGSSNGTHVNGRRLDPGKPLRVTAA